MSLPVPPKVGMRVIAHGDSCAHTCNGAIESLTVYAPVAVVVFDCGCRAYVPLRRLDPEPSGDGRCSRPGCRRTEWPVGTGTCMRHKNAAATGAASPASVNTPGVGREQPFDSKARPSTVGTSAPSPRGGRADIDGRGTSAGPSAVPRRGRLRREHSAMPAAVPTGERASVGEGRMAPSKPGEQAAREGQHAAGRIAGGGRASTPGALAAAGAVAQEEPPAAPPAPRPPASAGGRQTHPKRWWTRERIIAAFHRYHRETGRSPSADVMNKASMRPDYMPPYSTVKRPELFGSWSAALAAAELPPNPVGRPRKAAA